MLTPPQIAELVRIIKLHADHFLVSMFGRGMITKADLQELIKAGLIPPSTDPKIFENAFILGKLKAILTAKQYKHLKYGELEELAKEKWATVQPLSKLEQSYVDSAKRRAARGIRNINRDITDGLYAKIEEEEQKQFTEATVKERIRDIVVTAKKTRMGVTSLASALPRELKSYSRDWLRVASTELHMVRQRGVAEAISQGTGVYEGFAEDPEDRRVFIRPTAGACDECKRDYLDKRGVPKVFKLSELLANGTNVGVPKKNRKPIIPPHHCWCLCETNYMPPGHSFKDDGTLYLSDPVALYGKILSGKD